MILQGWRVLDLSSGDFVGPDFYIESDANHYANRFRTYGRAAGQLLCVQTSEAIVVQFEEEVPNSALN